MVRDGLNRTAIQCQKQNKPAEIEGQSQAPEEGTSPEQSENPDRQLEPLWWNQPVEEPIPWSQISQTLRFSLQTPHITFLYMYEVYVEGLWSSSILPVTGAEADFFTHLRPFSSQEAYKLVRHTYQQLQHSGFYWGPMTMEEAHEKLSHAPIGTFLIRDSGQPDVFFTLSYQSEDGPTSVRIILENLLFNLYGSLRTFSSLFALLTYYTSSSCKLTEPYRKQRPERLKQMCRRAVIRAYGSECTSTLPGLSVQMKAYVRAYPHCI